MMHVHHVVKYRESTMRHRIKVILVNVHLNFRILALTEDGLGWKYKTGEMSTHIFRTEVKNEWSYASTLSLCPNDTDRDHVVFYLLLYNFFSVGL